MYFLTILGAGKSRINILADLESLVSLPIRALILLDQSPTLMTSFNLPYLLIGLSRSPNIITLGVGTSDFLEDKFSP